MRIVIIGTGNTATVLGKSIIRAGHAIIQVIGRTSKNAEQLAKTLHSSSTTDQTQLNTSADLYLVAVSDNAIPEIASWLRADKKLVVHTAGSVECKVLQPCSKNFGVLYPLQSLRKEMDHLPEIPFLVDGNTADNGALIFDFAKTISADIRFAVDHQRFMTHIAAVMVSNFTNHLYAAADDFCKKENIDFKLLQPLIEEIATRLRLFSPAAVQTGPAIRNDTDTIRKHIELLEPFPLQQSLYRVFTESIQQTASWHTRIDAN
ncbi:MAG: DUF2520 domain-containing protein [Chitinophagaceae bacterium]|nr:DUF2520 domain-containing protein [Chitinophagaceae bacterium]